MRNKIRRLIATGLLLFSFLPKPSFSGEFEQPPFEVTDPAATENFRRIYFDVDQLSSVITRTGSSSSVLCIYNPVLCVDGVNRRVGINNATPATSLHMSSGTLMIDGTGAQLYVAATSNQILLGSTRTVTFTAPTPASASRVVTFPDLSADYSVVGTAGTQTVGGVKTFTSNLFANTLRINGSDTGNTIYQSVANTPLVITVDGGGSGYVGLGDSTLGASFKVQTTGHVSVEAAKRFYLDGGGDTYIYEKSANVFAVVTGGTERLRISGTAIESPDTVFRVVGVNSATFPDYSRIDDTNTGLRLPGSDTLALTTAGSDSFAIDATGAITQPNQPSFLAYLTSNTSNVTGDGTVYTAIFDAEVYDQNADFNLGTSIFTAPITGRYTLSAGALLEGILAANSQVELRIVTSNRTYSTFDIQTTSVSGDFTSKGISICADMDVNDTASVAVRVSNGTKVVDLTGSSTVYTFFSGTLSN